MAVLVSASTVLGSESFNATTSTINLGVAPSQDLVGQTCLAYAFPVASGENSNGYVWSKTTSASSDNVRFVIVDSAGTPFLFFGAGSTGTANQPNRQSSVSLVYKQWAHIALTWTGSLTGTTISLFQGMNGTPLIEVAYSATNNGTGSVRIGTGNNLHIGNREATDRTFNGNIAYVARWSRLLSLAELRQAQQYGPLIIPQGLILCWANGHDYGPYNLFGNGAVVVPTAGRIPPMPRLGPVTLPRMYFDMSIATFLARQGLTVRQAVNRAGTY